MWSECGLFGPANSYVTVRGTRVLNTPRKSWFCGCKWCPNPFSGGVEVRFADTKFTYASARDATKWRGKFDSILWDEDGSLTGVPFCHVHGCWLHPPIDGGLGYFPPDACELHPVGIVCGRSVAWGWRGG